MTELDDDGILVLRGAMSAAFCSKARQIISAACDDKVSLKQRIVNLHIDQAYLQEFSCNKTIAQILSHYITDPVCYTSLCFKRGTQQPIHRDVPHFFSNPIDSFYGVWLALEYTNLSNGALEYYPQSHKVPVMSGRLFATMHHRNPPTKSQIEALLPAYEDYCERQYVIAGLKKKVFIANEGDVVIWHPRLAHGGGDYVLNDAITRYSMVTHWKAKAAPIWQADKFFAIDEHELPNKNYGYKTSYTGVEYVDLKTVYNQTDYIS
jgi:ectoine hydroxylase-related dioxygenase (phytanoyl-CoA dioxygenase family)